MAVGNCNTSLNSFGALTLQFAQNDKFLTFGWAFSCFLLIAAVYMHEEKAVGWMYIFTFMNFFILLDCIESCTLLVKDPLIHPSMALIGIYNIFFFY